jgi:mono/diheme cytochrome c family protein
VAAVLSAVVPQGAAHAQSGPVLEGRAIAERNCARCHAVGPAGESRHKLAPPFRTLSKRYVIGDLAEALAEGLVVGHKDMPEFTFEPDEIAALLAYLESLGRRR